MPAARPAPPAAPATASAASAAQRRRTILLQHEAVWGGGQLDLIPQLYTPRYRGHFPGGTEVKGAKAMRDFIAGFRQAFPDWRQQVLELLLKGDQVATRYRSWGTQQGDFLGVKGHGQKVDILEASWFRLEGDRIAEQWAFPDSGTMDRQMRA